MIQELPDSLVQQLKQCRQLQPVGVQPEEAQALQDLVILLGESLSTYEKLCAQRQALDFIALEQATLRLLSQEDPGEILLRLDLKLQHLLVDEFQDTSQNQMELLCRLMAGWQAGEGRSLMVVGDPKQSIYGWRQAKPAAFCGLCPGPALPGGALSPGFPAAHHQLPGHPDLDRLGQRRLCRRPGSGPEFELPCRRPAPRGHGWTRSQAGAVCRQ